MNARKARKSPQVVVVTGASGGIGRATAEAFAARGAHVALIARGEAGLAGAVRDIEAAGGRALALPADVADAGQVEAAAAEAERRLGPIDVWVNVAFTSVFAPFDQIGPEEYRRVTEVSYLGYVYATRAALPHLIEAAAKGAPGRMLDFEAPGTGGIRATRDTLRHRTRHRAGGRHAHGSKHADRFMHPVRYERAGVEMAATAGR